MKNMKTMGTAGLAAGALTIAAVGGSLVSSLSADAATEAATTTATASPTSTPAAQADPSKGGHVANGITETLLTGDTATKAKAAALAAVPGGTVVRAETDAEGAAYEVHMTKSDGSQVTVKLDSGFKVTGTEDGMGAGAPNSSSQTK